MTREELIEVMARAILRDYEDGADMSTHPIPERAATRHALAALAALEAAGLRLVPVEAQVGMFKAMTQSWGDGPEQQRGIGRWALGSFREDYQAMIAASPYAPQKDTTHESD